MGNANTKLTIPHPYEQLGPSSHRLTRRYVTQVRSIWTAAVGDAWPSHLAEDVPSSVELRWRPGWSSGHVHGLIIAGGSDSFVDLVFERGAQRWQVEVAVDAAELLGCFEHARNAPAQRHLPVAPAFHVLGVLAAVPEHALDRVRGAQGPGQGRWHAEAEHGERLGQALTQAAGGAGVGLVQLAGQRLELRLGGQCAVGVVGVAHPPFDDRPQLVGQPVANIAELVQLTPS